MNLSLSAYTGYRHLEISIDKCRSILTRVELCVTDNLGDYRGSSQSYSNRLKNHRDDQMHSSGARSYFGNQESRDNKRNSRFNLNDNPIATKNIQGNRRISKNYNLEVRKPINEQDDMTLKEKPVVVMYGDSNTYDIDPERLTGKCSQQL